MAKKDSFFRDLIDKFDDTSIAADGKAVSEFNGFIDTGSYMLNALVSTSIFGGVPNNKITILSGESATGKTFFALGVVKAFLDSNPSAGVLYYDTEAAVNRSMLEERAIDSERIIFAHVSYLEQLKQHLFKFLKKYKDHEDKPPLMVIIDSISMLPSQKELTDTENEEVKANVGSNAKIIKGMFRELRQLLAECKVPLICTAHVYSSIGAYVPTKEMSGGSGPRYAADTILFLSKKKEKEGKDVVGNFITIKNEKNRLARENAMTEVRLSYSTGLDRYHGLLEFGEARGIFKRSGPRYELPDGRKLFSKDIYENPTDHFTSEILERIDEESKKVFSYGIS